jgi:hypothetical protein
MTTKTLLAAITLAFGGVAASANATDINASNWGPCLGNTSCTVDGATLTGSAKFDQKSNNGGPGLGISTATGGEIDIGETVGVNLGAAMTVTSIQLLFLYNGPEYNDRAEIAQITADNNTYTLSLGSLLDDTSGLWSGAGSVSKCGTTLGSGSGCFLLTNPFASTVQFLGFTALAGNPPFSGPGTNNSDYAIGRITAERKPVPEPGTLALFAMGLLGLAAARRPIRNPIR